MRSTIYVRWHLLAGAVLAVIASSALAGEITLYQNRDFRGDTLTLHRAAPDLERTGFNDSASSMVVREGVWEVCTDPFYRGNCTRLQPGEYNRLEGALNDRIASVREIVGVSVAPPVAAPSPPIAVAPPVAAAPPVVATAGPRIVLYGQPGFAGSGVEITETHGKLDRIPSYAPASAAIVYGGTWRLCTREYYRGQCADFTPGRYDSLGGLNGRIYSAELISAAPAPVGVVVPTPSAEGRVVLYDMPDFSGSSLAIDRRETPNLDWLGFGDRAASMRIESGYWMFCTDRGFRGTCRTYGPGEYPRLTPEVDHRIASIRRVNEVYGSLR
jgi:beta/gamma crystallin